MLNMKFYNHWIYFAVIPQNNIVSVQKRFSKTVKGIGNREFLLNPGMKEVKELSGVCLWTLVIKEYIKEIGLLLRMSEISSLALLKRSETLHSRRNQLSGSDDWESGVVFCVWLPPAFTCTAWDQPETTRTCHGVGAALPGCLSWNDWQCRERLPLRLFSISDTSWLCSGVTLTLSNIASVSEPGRELISVSARPDLARALLSVTLSHPSLS